jgi:hypothetical protein
VEILVSIDDTDDIDSRGTGDVAELLAAGLVEGGLAGRCGRVTRHQLLVHPDIAYTSHNSSMCFPAEVDPGALDAAIVWCRRTLAAESVEAADPGLCVAVPGRLTDAEALVAFGRSAKERVFTKEDAYAVASAVGAHLSEHGGTGLGVIGALAGAGLRLSGEDGRFKGKLRIPADGGVLAVGGIKEHGVDRVAPYVDGVVDQGSLGDDALVDVGATEAKLVLLGGEAVLLVAPGGEPARAPWALVDRRALRAF